MFSPRLYSELHGEDSPVWENHAFGKVAQEEALRAAVANTPAPVPSADDLAMANAKSMASARLPDGISDADAIALARHGVTPLHENAVGQRIPSAPSDATRVALPPAGSVLQEPQFHDEMRRVLVPIEQTHSKKR